MTDQTNGAMTRIVSAGKDSAGNTPRSIQRAFRLALARSAGELLNLPLSVIGVKQVLRTQDGLVDALAQGRLLLRFTSEGGTVAVCVGPGLVSAVVQTATIGEVMPGEPTERAFTDTDAAMLVPLIEDLFRRAQTLVDAPADLASLTGLEYAHRVDTLRELALGMVNDAYRVFDLTVDLAGGLRQGQLCVLLPDIAIAKSDRDAESPADGLNLGQSSGVMRAELEAMICRLSLPLAALSDLKAGDVLPLAGARLDRTEMQTIDRSCAILGRLGQCGGMRAVRVNETPQQARPEANITPEFLESPAGLPEPRQAFGSTPSAMPTRNIEQVDVDLSLANPDQIAAEITHLAGLPDEAEDGPPTG